MSLENKTVLVIGGSSGIGRGVADLTAAAGARLVLVGRDAEKLVRVQKEFADSRTFAVDATDEKALVRVMQSIGPVDHVVSTVGGAMGGGFMANSVEAVSAAVDGKYLVALRIAKVVVPYIREAGSLTITAGAGGRPHNASGAVIGNCATRLLVQGLAVELAPSIRVNAVSPTWMDTPLWRDVPREQVDETKSYFDRTIPLKRTATVGEVASAYIYAMTNTFVTGQALVVDGGLGLVQ